MVRHLLLAVVVALLAQPAFADEPSPKKVAVLIGIDRYDNAKVGNLEFANRDAVVLGLELENLGFTTTVLTTDMKEDRQPTKKNIEATLKNVSDIVAKHDTVLIFFSGQGFQFDDNTYLCPRDGRPFTDTVNTMIAVNDLLQTCERLGASNCFVLLDCCRVNLDPTRGIDRSKLQSTSGVGVLLACAKFEKSFESSKHKHGIFTHAVITGLRGEAKDRSGKITWDSLAA
jgi:uncharacterized caspase-like protein